MESKFSSGIGNDLCHDDAGVFVLVSELCSRTAAKYRVQSRVSQKQLVSKMRSQAYEIILKRSSKDVPEAKNKPIAGLLSHYFTSLSNVQNVAEYKRSLELKEMISVLRKTDFGEHKDLVHSVLSLLTSLSNTVKEDLSHEMYQRPFTCGLLEQMLPKQPRELFGSPQPYSYYPSHVFQLPYSLRKQADVEHNRSQVYSEYTVESFDSRSLLPDNVKSSTFKSIDVKTFASPMSLPSLTSSYATAYSGDGCLNLPRLTAPRDILIPIAEQDGNNKVTLADTKTDVNEVFRANFKRSDETPDIWDIASQVDKDIPDDIWEIVSKMPPIKERQLIAASTREMALWRRLHADMLTELNVISERQFIRHIMYLLVGIETNSFPFNQECSCFYMKDNLVLEGLSRDHIKGYVSDLLRIGTYYKRLYDFAFNQSLEDHYHGKGLVYEASREVVRRYLLDFRLKATEIYEECSSRADDDSANCMPTLLQILYHMEPLKYEIGTIASIYKMVETGSQSSLPNGAELMSYLFNEISLVTHKRTACTMFTALYTVCAVYFKFIERFIFEGELDDRYAEFFIRRDAQHVDCRSKRYWDKGFHIAHSLAVPHFLRSLAKCVLLCGKSLRLLKLCNPSDPLVVLISSDHPSVKCCSSFEELERQQRVLDVYRTRCLFVSGEPVTFEQILLKREAERKAFTEMASIKQHETLEKIVAERKRLAQLIIAEKQHSLRVLEAAMAEAKAAKNRSKHRERLKTEMEKAAEISTEEVDSKLRDDERNKIMEYYSKLNMEVEKSKLHMEWKIKRLQLDQSRMQLLSTEERNLKREKLELQHQKNEEVMAMSIRSDLDIDGNELEDQNIETLIEIKRPESLASSTTEFEQNKTSSQTSTDVFSSICNVAKSLFGVSKSDDSKICDNKRELDDQGNVVTIEEVNSNKEVVSKTSSDVIGGHLDNETDNIAFLKTKQDALVNRQKVMAHEFGQIDETNKNMPLINLPYVDDDNNIEDPTTAIAEAKRNKLKVLGADFNIVQPDTTEIVKEPTTDAQREALINKQKVLGVEYNLPPDAIVRNDPANVAQEEAITNKLKVMGVEYNLPLPEKLRKEPANYAQEQAIVNKKKILGSDYDLGPIDSSEIVRKEPANYAQEQAIVNKKKILGSDYDLGPIDSSEIVRKEPANYAQEQAIVNKKKILGSDYDLGPIDSSEIVKKEPANYAQEQAIVNKKKILGSDYDLGPIDSSEIVRKEPANYAQEQAIVNKKKILGSDYDLGPIDSSEIVRKEPANYAQEQALVNRKKVLGSDLDGRPPDISPRHGNARRSGLTLNLKGYNETITGPLSGVTPNTAALTPAEFFPRLDLETPTTADVPLMTGEIISPNNDIAAKDIGSTKNLKEFLTADGFNFPIIVDEESEVTSDLNAGDSVDNSPSRKNYPMKKLSAFDILDGSYSLDEFDPFGMKQFKKYSKDHFSSKMDLDMSFSCYTHPGAIFDEVQKKPYKNIFLSHLGKKENQTIINSDNIATLTACLQRSVMLPLTYQLEVVNNSILTYFLVNLDMYEHLRSLKDYFFLMDGEFCRSICHNLFTKLAKTINPQEFMNFATLHNILDKALGSSISHVHKFSENLSFTMTEPPLSFQHSSPDALQCLSLTYQVEWPLNIILSPEALVRYARVFQFLVKMRRISWVLGEDFECLKLSAKMLRDGSRKLMRSPQYITVQLYRHIMASLVRALDNYIVTTCIHTSWMEFENDLKKARTLDDLYECHVVYIKKVLFRCLLNNRSTPVMKLLNDIFTVILKFSRVLKAGEWHQTESSGTFTHAGYAQMEELFHLFEKLARYLHKVVTKLMECGYQRHLVELLTLVNLNGYYDPDRSKDHSSSVQVQSP